MENNFILFLNTVDNESQSFVNELNEFLAQNNCRCDIKETKSGYSVSYVLKDTKKTLATFVCRKTGAKLRIFTEHISQYQNFLNELPETMKEDIRKSSICKRLKDPDDCNSRCVMGYRFTMDDKVYEKCRYMAFMPRLCKEHNPYIKELIHRELIHR